jgi:hypothetical protein
MNWEFSYDGSNHVTTKFENYANGKYIGSEDVGGNFVVTVGGGYCQVIGLPSVVRVYTDASSGTCATVSIISILAGQVQTFHFGSKVLWKKSPERCEELSTTALTFATSDFITFGMSADTAMYGDTIWCLYTNKTTNNTVITAN